jgi:hypothetical protein
MQHCSALIDTCPRHLDDPELLDERNERLEPVGTRR